MDIEEHILPSTRSDEENNALIFTLRPTQIFSHYLFKKFANPENHDTSLVYPNLQHIERNSSFLSGKKLDYHNDGWAIGGIDYVMLSCLRGDPNIYTNIIAIDDIIAKLKQDGNEWVLDHLAQDFITDLETYEQHPILTKDGKINYADFGHFEPTRDYEEATAAKNILAKTINSIEPFYRESLNDKQAVIFNNGKTIHSRDIKDTELAPESRLLLRMHGDSWAETIKKQEQEELSNSLAK